MRSPAPERLPWHDIPPSQTKATCKVYLMEAGGLTLPEDIVLLPGRNMPTESLEPGKTLARTFDVPDYVFLIEHLATHTYYIFDLGMRKDLDNLPPLIRDKIVPQFPCIPVSPVDLLNEYGSPEQQPENIKAVIFSHMHFDHVGDAGKTGFTEAELWIGPTCCTYARPGYPVDPNGVTLSENLPLTGRKIVEPFIPDSLLEKGRDRRIGKVAKGKADGLYEGVELREPERGWVGLGAFDRAFDVFGDGAAYLVDAPGHSAGHQMMLCRVKADLHSSGEDDFVLLAGDCFHHPALLKEPERTARPPYSKESMHSEPDVAIDTIFRTRAFAERDNVWVIGAHDFSVGEGISSALGGAQPLDGLVQLNSWRANGWKKDQV
ncbi:hypothetical protein BS50DRAFT_532089 [Corynespora cassiicola Philippines]|uniref:Metallo-beta-lactamase domain-containing protein n=1 Tax=Corynespora cassiicola Philippines TaxID=1448308 RepID=A0A2T2NC83_CORCC|nr:hypothetical protein BS50DRAFT_532089 [Corynespora cassiicola Philippines]